MFGGVAIGRAKAQLHAKVMGIIKVYGLVSSATAKEAAMGIMILEVAVLEVSSVSQVMMITTTKTNPPRDKESRPFSSSPNQAERPLSTKPLAKANPPPKRKTIS